MLCLSLEVSRRSFFRFWLSGCWGLLTGLLQSTFLAVPLALSAAWNGTAAESAVVCRILAVLLCGCIGGLLGVTLRSRRHALR